MGYDSEEKTYTYVAFSSTGAAEFAKGKIQQWHVDVDSASPIGPFWSICDIKKRPPRIHSLCSTPENFP